MLALSTVGAKGVEARITTLLAIARGLVLAVQSRVLSRGTASAFGKNGKIDGGAITNVGSFLVRVGKTGGGIFAEGSIGAFRDGGGIPSG